MSGLIANTSSITRSTLYTTPSKVQLVSKSIFTFSSLPPRFNKCSCSLMWLSGTAPYMLYFGRG